MISAWRLDRATRGAAESFSGSGAQITGGRWNRKGLRAVYASESLALAVLERFVHAEEDGLDMALVAYRLHIPEAVAMDLIEARDLPAGWRREPASEATMDLGARWLVKGRRAVLRVPSAIVPPEHNFLLNPAHPDFAKIRVVEWGPFAFDSRMWK